MLIIILMSEFLDRKGCWLAVVASIHCYQFYARECNSRVPRFHGTVEKIHSTGFGTIDFNTYSTVMVQ
jgi:hypothetical protein